MPAATGTVTNTGGTSAANSSDQFTYQSAPSVSGVSPASGPTDGGTSITITGQNFANVTAVDYQWFSVVPATAAVVIAPSAPTSLKCCAACCPCSAPVWIEENGVATKTHCELAWETLFKA
jgi:hypothetical protein